MERERDNTEWDAMMERVEQQVDAELVQYVDVANHRYAELEKESTGESEGVAADAFVHQVPRFKPFFIHKQRPEWERKKHDARGFTAYIYPSADPRKVRVQFTICSGKDQFCKRDGRRNALASPVNEINVRELPKFLANLYSCTVNAEVSNYCLNVIETGFFYVWRYVV